MLMSSYRAPELLIGLRNCSGIALRNDLTQMSGTKFPPLAISIYIAALPPPLTGGTAWMLARSLLNKRQRIRTVPSTFRLGDTSTG